MNRRSPLSPNFPFDPKRILRQARSLCRNDEHGAEDLAQDFLVRALGVGAETLESPEQWGAAVLSNLARSSWARAYRSRELPVAEDMADGTPDLAPDLALERAQCISMLRKHLRRLPQHYRSALELTYLQGLSLAEAATRQGVPYGTLRARRQRGLRKLRAQLKNNSPDS